MGSLLKLLLPNPGVLVPARRLLLPCDSCILQTFSHQQNGQGTALQLSGEIRKWAQAECEQTIGTLARKTSKKDIKTVIGMQFAQLDDHVRADDRCSDRWRAMLSEPELAQAWQTANAVLAGLRAQGALIRDCTMVLSGPSH